MYTLCVLSRTLLLTGALVAMCVAIKIRYISTEKAVVTYYNTKYASYMNLTTRRHGNRDPISYVDFHFSFLYSITDNVSVHFYLYQFVNNTYRRGFVELHFKFCDLVHNNKFFGSAFMQGKLSGPCPYPAGDYHLYNMSMPIKRVPKSFPFTKFRPYINATITATTELIFEGYLDVEIKKANVKMQNKK